MPACRSCNSESLTLFLSLGPQPLSNAYLREDQLHGMEPFYPLDVYLCRECFLVQIEKVVPPEDIFSDYAYFSSYSDTWLEHVRAYADMAAERFRLGPGSLVMEVASNDGYLLQYFHKKAIPVLGIEPAANVAEVAHQRGIRTDVAFFGTEYARGLASKRMRADLLIGNNVLAHVPELNDFVEGLKLALKPRGVITMEFPHLMRLFAENQFDTIYHEHFSYFSFVAVERVFTSHGLSIFDVEEIPTHGGSLRVYAKHKEDMSKPESAQVAGLRERETEAGYKGLDVYIGFAEKVKATKRAALEFLIRAKSEGKMLVGYGAPAKGNTFLNYCGIRTDFLKYTVDRSPHKQGLFLPGTHIPIKAPEAISETKPAYIFILPWNLKEEIMKHMEHIRQWGGKFLVAIPRLEVL
jgi:SAM-dependent methyltransferase